MNRDVDVRGYYGEGDDIAKVGRTLIGMVEEHRERNFILDSIKILACVHNNSSAVTVNACLAPPGVHQRDTCICIYTYNNKIIMVIHRATQTAHNSDHCFTYI